jgi:hypothetical protein
VRSIIQKSKIADRKKNALFERLSDLEREVNTHGTRTDRFFAFAGDVGFVLGDMANKAKPLIVESKRDFENCVPITCPAGGVKFASGG